MSIPVLNAEGLPAGDAAFTGRVAEQEIKPHLIHETVVSELGRRRAGTHATKDRGQVRGGGRKPWRQKGTGRARAGSIRAPQWRGGGVAFGPSPRSYGGKVNRKVRAQAFRGALRAHADRGSVAVMDPTGWDTPSTKRAAAYLYQAPDGVAARPLLLLVDDPDGVEGLSFRNLSEVYVLAASDLEVVDLMAARSLLVERAVWERLTGGELSVSAVDVAAKPLPERTAPPKPKPISRASKKDDGSKRARKKADAPEADEAAVAEVDEDVTEATAAEAVADVEAPEVDAQAEESAETAEAPAEEPAAEVAVPEKPKRTRKAPEPAEEPAAEDATTAEVAAPEKPARTRKKAEPAEPAAEDAAPAKPARTRKKAEPAQEAAAEEAPAGEKPKRTRKKAEPAADETPSEDAE